MARIVVVALCISFITGSVQAGILDRAKDTLSPVWNRIGKVVPFMDYECVPVLLIDTKTDSKTTIRDARGQEQFLHMHYFSKYAMLKKGMKKGSTDWGEKFFWKKPKSDTDPYTFHVEASEEKLEYKFYRKKGLLHSTNHSLNLSTHLNCKADPL